MVTVGDGVALGIADGDNDAWGVCAGVSIRLCEGGTEPLGLTVGVTRAGGVELTEPKLEPYSVLLPGKWDARVRPVAASVGTSTAP